MSAQSIAPETGPSPPLAERRARHARIATAATVAAILFGAVAPAPALSTQAWVAAAAVLALGFPHGALDPLVAVARLGGGARLALVLALYVAAAAAVVSLWVLSAPAGLALFLATSALHFGLGDAPPEPEGCAGPGSAARRWPGRRALAVAAHGLGPIALPSALHPGAAGPVYGWVLGGPSGGGASGGAITAWLDANAAAIVGAWAVLAVLAIVPRPACARVRTAAELGLLALAFAALPPLLSFALYFCVWHSARHLIEVDARLGREERGRAIACAAAVLAATAGLLALLHASAAAPRSIEAITRTLFVALAALTPPHMIVTALLGRSPAGLRPAPSPGGRLGHA